MIVYHTSNVDVEKPDVKHSRNNLDFGKGFYVCLLNQKLIDDCLTFITSEDL
jgi:hypothetical protein